MEDEYEGMPRSDPKDQTTPKVGIPVGAPREESAGERFAAALALDRIGDPSAVTVLTAALNDPDVNVRQVAALVIGLIGPRAATASMLAALAVALGDDDTEVRRNVAFALTQLGPAAATVEVLAALRLAVSDIEVEVRRRAVLALGLFGPAAAVPEVVSALRLALQDVDGTVRQYAAKALTNVRSFQLLEAKQRELRLQQYWNWGAIALCLLVLAAWGLLVALKTLGFVHR